MNWNKIFGGLAIIGFGLAVYHMYSQAKKASPQPEIKKK